MTTPMSLLLTRLGVPKLHKAWRNSRVRLIQSIPHVVLQVPANPYWQHLVATETPSRVKTFRYRTLPVILIELPTTSTKAMGLPSLEDST